MALDKLQQDTFNYFDKILTDLHRPSRDLRCTEREKAYLQITLRELRDFLGRIERRHLDET